MTDARWSLSRQLSLRVLGLVLGTWVLSVALSVVALNHEMNEMFDAELAALVETTALSLEPQAGPAIARALGVETGDSERVLRIFDPAAPPPASPWPPLSAEGYHDIAGWRVLRREAEGAIIEAAHARSWRREELAEAALAMGVAILPLLLLLLWALRASVRSLTAPAARLSRGLAGRAPDDLSPLDDAGLPEELRLLATALSTYLRRIEALRDTERAFAANAAHELRTPLAEARARLELSADPDTRAAIARLDVLNRRVERLLQMSRLQAELGLGRGPADAVRILRLLLAEIRPHSRHEIRFDDGDCTELIVAADPDALAIVLRNLIENAAEHGLGPVRIRLAPDGTLRIANPAPEGLVLPATRGQPGAGSRGSGLGLSIVAQLAAQMGLPLDWHNINGELAVVLHLPLSARR